MMLGTKLLPFLLACLARADSLSDVKHVVLFMQENRAFDHYFGTMAGVRGFADPNVQVNQGSGLPNIFHQPVTSSMTNATDQLTPWYLNYLGGTYPNATQCMTAGSNAWTAMHEVFNQGKMNGWATADTPWSMGYYQRNDLETHWDVADGWTIGDMYQESVLAATDPNRVVWMSGTVNQPGSPSNPNGNGGMILGASTRVLHREHLLTVLTRLDNNASPGCEKPHLNCFPFTWQTVPEVWQNAGATWQLYQSKDNFEDNMLAYFQQYQNVSNDASNPLTKYGNSYIGLNKFFNDAKSGSLPMISVIVGPQELAEHPPNRPVDGAWLINQVVNAVTKSPLYNETALLISYDETGGWADHVTPFHAPKGTPGEWIKDPYGIYGQVPVGPGFRMPFFIVSPWTRGGNVFVEHASHESQIMFVEKFLQAHGYSNVETPNITPWRRQHLSDLTNAFNFDSSDLSLPDVSQAPTPAMVPKSQATPVKDGELGALSGNYAEPGLCLSTYKNPAPPVPYGASNAAQNVSQLAEEGFKQVRGNLTEGRYLTFETQTLALANNAGKLTCTAKSSQHDNINQRWVLHESTDQSNPTFAISSAANGAYIGSAGTLTTSAKKAAQFTVAYVASGSSYTLSRSAGKYLNCGKTVTDGAQSDASSFQIFSVIYH